MDNKTMTAPKKMTDGQIDDLANKIRDAARKHRDELSSEAVQKVLGTDNLGMMLLAPFRKLVEMESNMFTRLVSGINRNQTPRQALDATGLKQYTTQSVVDSMPRGEGENVELKFFWLDYNPTITELGKEYERRSLKADLFALCKHMEDDPEFADERPVACQWDIDENEVASYAAFRRWHGERGVVVGRYVSGWPRRYRFAGVCK